MSAARSAKDLANGVRTLFRSARAFPPFACLAWVPTNCLLGQHTGKSIENWDHWRHIYVYFGAERGWKDDPCDLPPYYQVE